MARLGIFWRIVLIVALALFVIQLVVFEGVRRHKADATVERRYSVGERIVPYVQLLDRTPIGERPTIVALARTNGIALSFSKTPPADLPSNFGSGLVRISFLVRHELERQGLDDRFFAVGPGEELNGGDGDNEDERRILVQIGLASGEVARFDVNDTLTVRILGWPIGFGAGALGFIVAIVALCAVAREARPIAALSRAVDRLGTRLQPEPLPEAGAKEVRTLIRAINAMQHRIANLINNRTFVIGAISHDLKTNLTRLRLRLEMMPDNPHRARALQDVETMQGLMTDALIFAKAALAVEEVEAIDVADMLATVLAERAIVPDVLTLAEGTEAAMVRIQPAALRRVIDNLIDNALRYGEGYLAVSLVSEDEHVVMAIRDRGPGIASDMQEAVFDPFVRVESSRSRDTGGSGLGLTIVRQIVEAYGGTVRLGNLDPQGLEAVVTLPRGQSGPRGEPGPPRSEAGHTREPT
ncbi:HAMP domain-containing protein [Rhizobiales bacterium RZME27]|uniref:histidine kinase n=1 Tax=Endobacterium cereale TaxID=2663029 RepID=A0A6A8ADR1_9HYPH|nr:ATP-binding protein [Endobacterium cereale]MEB2845462.1 ATP-binding protein [Endobacterium cereale]MQY48909.1 HAMP domain-containing protein [Endobacterium cereale]